ncbi:hypothetical protein [Lentzea sp. NBRC 102530]|uniref:hypothetical protein n=1 Tax=Lentzea sp. NBRC 102530 TaxID=3032201 RepID=UPI00249F9F42|nr:hypothetical protein [Lentzea sp. NBRC 102530]GLY53859.1 hypothetical protein Lesp01_75150 [Lentzea sp. NBRC 102530]
MSQPQDPNPWDPSPQSGPAGAYEVGTGFPAAPVPPELAPPAQPQVAPPLDHAQWQNPAGAYPVQPTSQYPIDGQYPVAGQYQVNQVGGGSFAMAPLSPVLPHEMAPPRPATITAAMWIWIAAAVLSVAVLPVLFLVNTDGALGQGDVVTEQDRQATEIGMKAFAVISGFGMLVAAAPYVAFAIVLRNGHNWARVLLTILAVLGLLAMISILFLSIAATVWMPSVTLAILVIGLSIAAVVLQFLPASNRYVR